MRRITLATVLVVLLLLCAGMPAAGPAPAAASPSFQLGTPGLVATGKSCKTVTKTVKGKKVKVKKCTTVSADLSFVTAGWAYFADTQTLLLAIAAAPPAPPTAARQAHRAAQATFLLGEIKVDTKISGTSLPAPRSFLDYVTTTPGISGSTLTFSVNQDPSAFQNVTTVFDGTSPPAATFNPTFQVFGTVGSTKVQTQPQPISQANLDASFFHDGSSYLTFQMLPGAQVPTPPTGIVIPNVAGTFRPLFPSLQVGPGQSCAKPSAKALEDLFFSITCEAFGPSSAFRVGALNPQASLPGYLLNFAFDPAARRYMLIPALPSPSYISVWGVNSIDLVTIKDTGSVPPNSQDCAPSDQPFQEAWRLQLGQASGGHVPVTIVQPIGLSLTGTIDAKGAFSASVSAGGLNLSLTGVLDGAGGILNGKFTEQFGAPFNCSVLSDVTGARLTDGWLQADQEVVTLPDTPAGSTSAAQALTFTNVGNANVTISGADLVVGGSDFVLGQNGCTPNLVIGPGQSCSIFVAPHPQSAGTKVGQLDVRYTDSAGVPHTTSALLITRGVAKVVCASFTTPLAFSWTNPFPLNESYRVTGKVSGDPTHDVWTLTIQPGLSNVPPAAARAPLPLNQWVTVFGSQAVSQTNVVLGQADVQLMFDGSAMHGRVLLHGGDTNGSVTPPQVPVTQIDGACN